jgi:hypothetical protein
MARLQRGHVLIYDEYIELYRTGYLCDWAGRRGKYVVCSAEDARAIFYFANLCIPMLVLASPAERAEDCHLRLTHYLTYLATKETVDVHTYDQAPDEAGDSIQPVAVDTGQVTSSQNRYRAIKGLPAV